MPSTQGPSPVVALRGPLRRLIGRTIALSLVRGMATTAGSLIVSSIVWWATHR